MKIIDIDKLFDEFIKDYVYGNIGKVKPEEIENQIPKLYEKFGNTPLDKLDGKTPNEYYLSFSSKELVMGLETHIKNNVSVSDFIIEALVIKGEDSDLISKLNEEENEELLIYLINILKDKNSKDASKSVLNFVLYDYSETLRELATEFLYDHADEVKEQILLEFNNCKNEVKECLTDILSHASKDDKVFDILMLEFEKNPKKLALYAGFICRYGDERALPFLLEAIERDKISYADFEELRFAIESLGGEYNKERDFSSDKSYKAIKGISLKKK